MIIKVKKNEQTPEITINFEGVTHTYAIKDAIKLALSINGFSEKKINEIIKNEED